MGIPDVAQKILRINKMVARIDISVMLHHKSISTGLSHRAHSRSGSAPERKCRVEELDIGLPYVIGHPLVENVAQEPSISLGRN